MAEPVRKTSLHFTLKVCCSPAEIVNLFAAAEPVWKKISKSCDPCRFSIITCFVTSGKVISVLEAAVEPVAQ